MRYLSVPSLAVCVLPALAALPGAQVGAARGERTIQPPSGSSGGALFGLGLTAIGDLNGDGVVDLAAAAPNHLGEGTLWVFFLDSSGGIVGSSRIGEGFGGFAGTLPAGGLFGAKVAAIGDLDGDGRSELAVSGNARSGGAGRVHILFLEVDGTVRAQNEITVADPVFGGAMGTRDYVYGALLGYPDIDGDSVPELLWGDPEADDGSLDSGALWVVRLNTDGSAKGAHRIANGQGGFGGALDASDDFGLGLARVGDLNQDGFEDLVVLDNHNGSAPSGRLWTLFLDGNAQVLGENVFTAAELDLRWGTTFVSRGSMGLVEALGDLDGDGVTELAIGSSTYNNRGGVAITFIARNGALRKRLVVANDENGLAFDAERRWFGSGLAQLGDLDGDGLPELAVGDIEAGSAGRVSILTLSVSALRNGSGVNPSVFRERAAPTLGDPWKLELDCSGHTPGLAYFLFSTKPVAGLPSLAGELLVDPSQTFLLLSRPHAGDLAQQNLHIPADLALVNFLVHAQGACGGAPGLTLSNAIDEIVGR